MPDILIQLNINAPVTAAFDEFATAGGLDAECHSDSGLNPVWLKQTNWGKKVSLLFSFLTLLFFQSSAQQQSVKDLDFLIGTWQTEEHNYTSGWWEKSTRTGTYILDSTYIQLEAVSISSSNKKRTYRFFIHYDNRSKQFEMMGIFSNWPKVQTDILEWDKASRRLTLKSKPAGDIYSERKGVIQFSENFNEYVWTGANKSGDPQKPSIFEYEEKGKKK